MNLLHTELMKTVGFPFRASVVSLEVGPSILGIKSVIFPLHAALKEVRLDYMSTEPPEGS